MPFVVILTVFLVIEIPYLIFALLPVFIVLPTIYFLANRMGVEREHKGFFESVSKLVKMPFVIILTVFLIIEIPYLIFALLPVFIVLPTIYFLNDRI